MFKKIQNSYRIKKCKTIFNVIRNNNIESRGILKKADYTCSVVRNEIRFI